MRAVGLGVALLAAGCDDTLFGVEATVTEPESRGYAGVVEIVDGNCLGCHSAAAAASAGFGLDLETDLHAATVGVAGGYGVPLVTPNQSGDSMLYLKVTGAQPDGTGGVMPPGANGLPEALSNVIAEWIDDGAPSQ